MNSVLNKDFDPRSYLNSALISFSDVFRPASCMQSYYLGEPERRIITDLVLAKTSYERVCASRERRT